MSEAQLAIATVQATRIFTGSAAAALAPKANANTLPIIAFVSRIRLLPIWKFGYDAEFGTYCRVGIGGAEQRRAHVRAPCEERSSLKPPPRRGRRSMRSA